MHNPEARKLYLFDVDDTLVISDVRIIVKTATETLRLTTAEYREFRVNHDEKDFEFSYEEFMHVDSLKGKRGPGFLLFAHYVSSLSKFHDVGLLSNRSTPEPILEEGIRKLAASFGVRCRRLREDLIFATNSATWYPTLHVLSASQQKAELVSRIIPPYDEVVFVDDDPQHLYAVGGVSPKIVCINATTLANGS